MTDPDYYYWPALALEQMRRQPRERKRTIYSAGEVGLPSVPSQQGPSRVEHAMAAVMEAHRQLSITTPQDGPIRKARSLLADVYFELDRYNADIGSDQMDMEYGDGTKGRL